MKIERLEINGFKSFSERIVFQFHHGVTAVVGPNGSGKSNVVDAFKWVLGEQSAKSLRGERMDDVVFSGSATKKPKGMAEVFLFVSGFEIPDDKGRQTIKELSVSRRIFCSGDTDYFINKRHCRLKDIRDLFLDTGLGHKSYSIFEQGRVDAILQSKPEERRFLIDEIAGVAKYKVRKLESIQKIEAARQNLTRLEDVISEVKRQVDTLSRQVRRAEKYKKLLQALKEAELRVAAHDYRGFHQEYSRIQAAADELVMRELALTTEIAGFEAKVEDRKLVCLDSEKALRDVQAKLHKTEKAITETQGRINLLNSELKSLADRAARMQNQQEELKARSELIHGRSAQLQNSLKQFQDESDKLALNLKEKEAVCVSSDTEIKALENTIREDRKELIKYAETVSAHKNRIHSLLTSLKEVERRQAKLEGERTQTEGRVQGVQESVAAVQTALTLLNKGLKEEAANRQTLRDAFKKAHTARADTEQRLYKAREEVAALASRLDSLKEMDSQEEQGALPKDVAVLGQIANVVEADPVCEMAVEAALGEQLRFYLVNDKEAVQKALSEVKLAGSGRCGFVLSGFAANHDSGRTYAESNGVVGKAIDFVTAREPYTEVVRALLGSVLIVRDLDTAFSLWNKDGWHIVTLEGQLLTPGGLAKGGREGGVLRLKRQIRETQTDVTAKKRLLSALTQSLEKLSNELSIIKRDTNASEKKITTMEKERDSQTLKMEHYHEELARLKRRVSLFDTEAEEIRTSQNRLAEEQSKTQSQLATQEQEKEALSQKMDAAQAQIDKQKEGLEAQRQQITSLKLSLTATEEKRKAFLRELKGLEGEKESAQKKIANFDKEAQDTEKERLAKKAELSERESGLKATVTEVSSLKTDFDTRRQELDAMKAEIDEVQRAAKTKSAALQGLRKELADWTVRKEKTAMKLEQVAERIRETYGVEIASYQAEEPGQDEAAQIQEMKRKLEDMGQVDPAVSEEFNREKERYDNLINQQSDLVQSIEHLESIIIKIDKTIRARLTEGFHKMNEKFKEVFLRLFGSGRAELVLLGDDILEAGIEIIAQPPGKKPRSLLALSGGEKALTAISLLFAGFMIKPTPLCIFDEVDAPLDESNTGKFSDMIRELSRETQFILITHNKLTMEAADFIYGVTMEEAGSSSIVSLKLGGDNYENQKAQSAVA